MFFTYFILLLLIEMFIEPLSFLFFDLKRINFVFSVFIVSVAYISICALFRYTGCVKKVKSQRQLSNKNQNRVFLDLAMLSEKVTKWGPLEKRWEGGAKIKIAQGKQKEKKSCTKEV